MPLALELAASWVDTLSLMDIAVELQQGLDLLETELRDVPQRQRSVRATFDYSWRKLDEREQSIFAQLSIFREGFTRSAAQAVTGETLLRLSRLVNKSFIQFSKQRDRYQVHELLRQYGAGKLVLDGELETAARDRHSAYYCHALGQTTDDLKGARQLQALTAIEADLENVRLAWNHAVARQDLAAIGTSLEALYRFYWNEGKYLGGGTDDFEKAAAILRTGETIGARGIVLGRLLAILGWFYSNPWIIIPWILDPVKAKTVAKESLDLLQRLGAQEETIMPLLILSMHQESLEESSRLLSESLTLARQFGDLWAIGDALLRLGLNARAAAIASGQSQILLDCLATVAELFLEEGNLDQAATLASLITNHPISRGKANERGDQILIQSAADLSSSDLANIRQRSQQSDLAAVAAQLLVDLKRCRGNWHSFDLSVD